MKVEIWSDVMCPFCYIGKRRFEKALEEFPEKDKIEVEWKSYQLNPTIKTQAGKSVNQYLAENKGWSLEYAQKLNSQVTEMAAAEGLEYNMDKAVVANTFNAHRISQLAKQHHKGDLMEELLFRAYFTEGKNIDDKTVLLELATSVDLDKERVKEVLEGNEFSDIVEKDIYEAHQIGVKGVPFFVFNDKYSVSGAQATETFTGVLAKAWEERDN